MISDRTDAEKAQTSITSISVAAAFARSVLLGHDYLFDRREALLANHFCEASRNTVRGILWAIGAGLSSLPYSAQQAFFSYTAWPSYDNVIMLRKLMIHRQIEAAIARGVTRIVFFSGGCDVRALFTVLNNKDIHAYEIDIGLTRQAKLGALKTIPKEILPDGLMWADNSPEHTEVEGKMHYLEADLSVEHLNAEYISDVLKRASFDGKGPALFIAEGLTMYLDKQANQRLLQAVSEMMHPDSEIIISYQDKPMYTAISKWAISKSKETYKSVLPVNEVIPFTSAAGLDVTGKFTAADSLELIGDQNAEYFATHPGAPREHYYTLRKQPVAPGKTMADVSEIVFAMPPKPVAKKEEGCVVC